MSIGGSPRTGTWLYVVSTWDGAEPRMYLDGELTAENLGSPSTIGDGSGNLVFGDFGPGQFYKLDGELDEVAIYSYALSAAQVAAHFAAAK